MTRPWPRRTPDGRLVPFVAAWLRGKREAQRLEQAEGLVLDQHPDRLAELGWSLARDDVPTPADHQHLATLLDQAQARNRRVRMDLAQTRRWPGTAPDPRELPRPRPGRSRSDDGNAPGQGDPRARGQSRTAVRNETIDPIAAYLSKDQDDDQDWTPT
jgi:hypothetical protein